MNSTLAKALDAVGIPPKPRFSIEEVAEILDLQREQVIDLLKKGKLLGVKSSSHRWRYVFAEDLDAFLEQVNAPRKARKKAPGTVPYRPLDDGSASLGSRLPSPLPSLPKMTPAYLGLDDPPFSLAAGLPLTPYVPQASGRRELDL